MYLLTLNVRLSSSSSSSFPPPPFLPISPFLLPLPILRHEDQESPQTSKSSKEENSSASQRLLDDDDDVIPATPPPANQAAKRRKRSIKVKKLKDRTYLDDEGNFVTEKVGDRWLD